jgi:hypothetical protein
MSVREIKYNVRKCDFCGKEIKDTAHCHEGFRYALQGLKYEVWYSGVCECSDICVECNQKICTFLYDNGFFDHGVKS